MKFYKTALAALTLAAASTFSANANLPFTVDPDMDGNPAESFVADKIFGEYYESIVLTPGGGTLGSFQTNILLVFDTFNFEGDVVGAGTDFGAPPVAGVNSNVRIGEDYTMYSLLTLSGEINLNMTGGFALDNINGGAEFWYSADQFNGGISAPFFDQTTGAFNTTNLRTGGSDLLLGTVGSIGGSVNQGSSSSFLFETPNVANNITLTADGMNYFTKPNPFYNMLVSTGDISELFDEVDFSGSTANPQFFNGQANVSFVNSPSTIAMMSLTLLALAFRARAKK